LEILANCGLTAKQATPIRNLRKTKTVSGAERAVFETRDGKVNAAFSIAAADHCFCRRVNKHKGDKMSTALENRDYVLVLDKSGSMSEKDCPGGKSRWASSQESTHAIASKVAEWDNDGLTVIPFASTHKVYENTTPAKVTDIFKENEPMGGTTLAPVLKAVFESYKARKKAGTTKPNGELLIVVTDGQPSDEAQVAKEIVAFGNSLENADAEYGIQFLQVGKDQAASQFLKKLDDDLTKQGAKHDIVDTKTMDELENIGLTEALLAALND
jgi:Mg-chelatase subunit ChlD